MENKKENISSNNDILKTKITQLLPDYITTDIILKPALCVKIEKKNTSVLLSKLKKNNLILDKIYLKDINYHIKNIDKVYQKPNNAKDISKYQEFEGTFLKRVKKYNDKENLVLISFMDDLQYKKITKENIMKDYSLAETDLIEVEIPCTESISNEQYYKNNKIWPQCNYISSKEKYIYNHSEKEEKDILDIYNFYFLLNNKNDISSLLYNPKSKKILVKSTKNEKSIIGHSIMNLLDLYSQMLVEDDNKNKHENKEKDKDKEKNENKNDEIKELKLGEKNPVGPKENTDYLFNFDEKNKGKNKNGENENDDNHQYYCEGLYVFTKEEPCMMCAMALVHNRISRLYFSDINQKDGALVSKYSLDNYNLNHHYLIFKFS